MSPRTTRLVAAVGPALALVLGWTSVAPQVSRVHADVDFRTAPVTRGPFKKTVRRQGVIKPVNEQHIITRIWGQILEIAPQGRIVAKDEVILRLDPTPYEDQKIGHEAHISSLKAQFKKQVAETQKGLNAAREDVASLELRVTLEQMRLADVKKGPTTTDAINAKVNLENAKALLAATREELDALKLLAPTGFISKEEIRQKELEVRDQELKLRDAEINKEKLYVLDKVKLAEQELKLRDAEKTRDAAKERLELYERNFKRDNENRARWLEREEAHLKKLKENIDKTVYRAPAAGSIIHKRARWYAYQPGRDVHDGWEVMAIPEYTRMKVALTVDEARIGNVTVGQAASITPAGWNGAPCSGKVIRVADKGRDEFEQNAWETKDITGTANRQVFDVEVEIDGQSPVFLPGLRAMVEIVLDSRESALLVPRAAVFRNSVGETIARVISSGATEVRRITIVAQNEYFAVVEGLQEGDRVMIVPETEKKP
ncbi:MAG TPA: HlyD family efflux transporter periplasmic adaptor subunit [Planctomycetota bacterium]|nr:HlyD family efflux transporter periplasmic adaptor subunit [Planctomycetota bacterium]